MLWCSKTDLHKNILIVSSLSGKDYLRTIDTDELYTFISRYKFIISYENSVCEDYVTEKIWRTLIVGSVPIYFGAPNIKVCVPASA